MEDYCEFIDMDGLDWEDVTGSKEIEFPEADTDFEIRDFLAGRGITERAPYWKVQPTQSVDSWLKTLKPYAC